MSGPYSNSTLDILREALEDRSDAISNAAQILLHSTPSERAPGWWPEVNKIHQSARRIFHLVRAQLGGEQGAPSQEDLHGLRHDIRGHLQNIMLRCECLEDGDIDERLRFELRSIARNAQACVEALNENRDDRTEAADAVPAPLSLRSGSEDGVAVANQPGLGTARILVADDNPDSRELLGSFLKEDGHEVSYAVDGAEALRQTEERDFNLILLDLVMPQVNGFDVLQELRRRDVLQHTFVIIISGLDSDANAIRGIELGAVDYLARPIKRRLLRARVNACLDRQRLRERELEQFFTPKLARQLLRHRDELAKGKSLEISCLFCDIVGFSHISEQHGPELTIRWLGDVLDSMSTCVIEHEGALIDYTGDQVVAVWGAPQEQPDHANRACRTALAMVQVLPEVNQRWQSTLGLPTEVTIGINTGPAFVGNIGTPQKFKYGALGKTVNLASRVQGACKYARSRVLCTGDTIQKVTIPLPERRLAQVRVANLTTPVHIHELGPPEADPPWFHLKTQYETALQHYESKEFRKASSVLGTLLDDYPADGPSLLLMSRVVQELLQHDQRAFDPVWELPGK